MIKLENEQVVGWEHAIRGMRNPMNSWKKSDSDYCDSCRENNLNPGFCDENPVVFDDGTCYLIGPNDYNLMMRLRNAGTDHRKFMRMIVVYVDITAPLYWWKEFDTYKVGTVANSCSTMHKIAAKEFTLEDFSCEHLMDFVETKNEACLPKSVLLEDVITALNICRSAYLETKTKPMKNEAARKELMKKYWWQMIQLLPSSYNQKRTVMLNYEVLANIYKSRKNHKLDEWAEHEAEVIDVTTSMDIANGELYPHLVPGIKDDFGFCDWIETLPYSELITGIGLENKE